MDKKNKEDIVKDNANTFEFKILMEIHRRLRKRYGRKKVDDAMADKAFLLKARLVHVELLKAISLSQRVIQRYVKKLTAC